MYRKSNRYWVYKEVLYEKKIVLRCLLGASVGFIISFLITLIISACIGKGKYYPVHPQLTALCGNELNAVILQTACSLLYGAAFAGASVIWELEGWSLLKQTVVHCLIVSAASFPIAFFMYWMPHTFLGIAGYILIFFAIYFGIWMGNYLAMKKKIRAINEKMKEDADRS